MEISMYLLILSVAGMTQGLRIPKSSPIHSSFHPFGHGSNNLPFHSNFHNSMHANHHSSFSSNHNHVPDKNHPSSFSSHHNHVPDKNHPSSFSSHHNHMADKNHPSPSSSKVSHDKNKVSFDSELNIEGHANTNPDSNKSYRYLQQLTYKNKIACNTFFIRPKMAITLSSCVIGKKVEDLRVRHYTSPTNFEEYEVSRYATLPLIGIYTNVATIYLKKPAKNVQLYKSKSIEVNDIVKTFETFTESNSTFVKLKYLEFITPEECSKKIGRRVFKSELCFNEISPLTKTQPKTNKFVLGSPLIFIKPENPTLYFYGYATEYNDQNHIIVFTKIHPIVILAKEKLRRMNPSLEV